MRLVIWFIVCLVLLTLFAHAVQMVRSSVMQSVEKCHQHAAEVSDVR